MNESFQKLKDYVIFRLHSKIISLCDILNTYVFGESTINGNGIFSDLNENTFFSNKLNDMFEGSKFYVVTYLSKIPNAFTFPGIATNKGIFFMRYLQTLPIIGKLINAIQTVYILPSIIVQIFNHTIQSLNPTITTIKSYTLVKNGIMTNNMLTYNESTKKFKIAIPEITIYISESLIALLEEDEVTAILLHEIGHNTQIALHLYTQLANLSLGGTTLGAILTQLYQSTKLINTSLDHNGGALTTVGDKSLNTIYLTIIIGIIVAYILSYLGRRQEIYSDEFAIKCGYGEALSSSINKLRSFNLGAKKSFIITLADKLIYYFNVVDNYITEYIIAPMRLHIYPSMRHRQEIIDEKTKKYNLAKSDRSNDIDTSLLM